MRGNQSIIIHGTHLGLGLMSFRLLIYFCHLKIMAAIIICERCLHRQHPTTTGINQTVNSKLIFTYEEQQEMNPRDSPPQMATNMNNAARVEITTVIPRERSATASVVHLPSQILQPP